MMYSLVCCLQMVQNIGHRMPNNPIRNYTNILQKRYHYCKPVVQIIYCTLKLFQFQLRSRSFLPLYLNNVKQLRCVSSFLIFKVTVDLKHDFIFLAGGGGGNLCMHTPSWYPVVYRLGILWDVYVFPLPPTHPLTRLTSDS